MRNNFNFTAVLVAVIIVMGVLAAVYMIKGPEKQTVSVTGNSEMSVDPDLAVVYFRVETRSADADNASDENAVIVDSIISSLKAEGFDDIETMDYYIYPEYDWVSGRQTLKGYVATHTLKVSTEDFDKVGTVIDIGVDEGALVNNINFELSNEMQNQYKAQVMQAASQDARNKASALASGLGKNLGDIVSVSTSDYRYMPYPLFEAKAGAAEDLEEVATNIQPQSLTVYATVSVVYELK